jgi:1-acyl-sn-glycerol-3-phosphate acyltransferase
MMTNIKYTDKVDNSLIKAGCKSAALLHQLATIPILSSLNLITDDSLHDVTLNLLRICNININIINANNVSPKQKVIISNHTNYLDSIVIYAAFKCGFLSSSIIRNIPIMSNLIAAMPIITVNRGTKKRPSESAVTKIKQAMNTQKVDVCVFPEGIITHFNSMAKFRTGAFNIGYDVQPIVITYDPVIYDDDHDTFILKTTSCDKINVTITVLPIKEYPFDQAQIEEIRREMAETGNIALSRVSNQYVVD